jgi:hypothetical protein
MQSDSRALGHIGYDTIRDPLAPVILRWAATRRKKASRFSTGKGFAVFINNSSCLVVKPCSITQFVDRSSAACNALLTQVQNLCHWDSTVLLRQNRKLLRFMI